VTVPGSAHYWSESADDEEVLLTSDGEGRDGAIAPSALCAARLMSARGCQLEDASVSGVVFWALLMSVPTYLPSRASSSPPHETCIAGRSRGLLWAALSTPAMRCRKWSVPEALTQAALTADG
jgi:hypothetical protein